jgi:hypothetical protein
MISGDSEPDTGDALRAIAGSVIIAPGAMRG